MPKFPKAATASLLVALSLLAACGKSTPPPAADAAKQPAETAQANQTPLPPLRTPTAAELEAQRKEIEDFRATRDANLRKPDSWLSLVGLAWLQPGDNSVGSAPTADVVLPPSVKTQFATLHLPGSDGAVAELIAQPGQKFTIEGKEQTRAALKADTAEGGPTIVQVGTVQFFVIDRQGKIGVRVKDSASPTFAAYHGIEHFPIDWAWRVEGRWEPYDPPKKVAVPNVLGQSTDEDSPGAFVFERGGKVWRLDAVEGSGEQGIHFIFADGTSGKETYGGGRFLNGKVDQPDRRQPGTAVVDFNLAYNPPCVFTPYATCPLPPSQNKIALRIEAGEKTWGQH
jgi:uncharacterized protein (DUF1684 family)